MSLTFVITFLGTLLSSVGGLIVILTPGKRDPKKETSLTDTILPFLVKDSPISPQKIFNDLYGDKLERKRTMLRNFGIICFSVGSLLLLVGLLLAFFCI
jgi:hypothetical protein